MNGDQRVHCSDLEQADDARIGRDDPKAPTRVRESARGAHQRAYSGRVEKRAVREVHHDDLGVHAGERLLETRRRREVDLSRDTYDRRTSGHGLAADVKLTRHGHHGRV